MKHTLHLIPRPEPQRETRAWFVPRPDPASWLAVIAEAGLALSDVQVRVLPSASDDRAPLGALLTAPGWSAQPGPGAQPYGLFAQRLFLPTRSRLVPAIDEDELDGLLTTPSAILHPVVGLVGYEQGDVLRALSLVRPPEQRRGSWSMPEPGPEVAKRLKALEPDEPLSIQDVEDHLGEGFDQRPLDELPPAPDESKPGALGKAGRGAISGVAGVAAWLTSKAPGTASQRTWVDALHDWAMSHRRQPGQADQEQRNREINRLLEMLKKSPELGLSFAIPMSGLLSARGSGFSGNQLTQRNTGFSLAGLFGGGAADPWDIADQQQQELIRSYRKLAVAEAQKGSFRRAAYIYGTLLGDIEASARVLEEGGHYDEAAVILNEKLKQPINAARCLERGGRLTEAIALYLEHNHWVQAAELYRQLDQPDKARQWYAHAAMQLVEARDFCGAAKLFEEQLADVEEAERVLDLGWKPPNQDWACVPKRFELAGRHGRHAGASAVLDSLVQACSTPEPAGRLARTLAEVQACYPDAATRQALRAQVMQLAGQHLPKPLPISQARPLAEAVAAIGPDDRLLTRDARRYLDQRSSAGKPQRPHPPCRETASALTFGPRFNAPAGKWCRIFSAKDDLYVLGATTEQSDQLSVCTVTRKAGREPMVLSAPIKQARWNSDLPFDKQVVCACQPGSAGYPPILHASLVNGPRIAMQTLFQGDHALHVGHRGHLPETTLAMSEAMPNQTWVLSGTLADQMELVLNAYNKSGQLIQSVPVILSDMHIAELQRLNEPPAINLHARKDYVILTIGTLVMKYEGDALESTWAQGLPITSVRGAVPFGRSRYALFLESGLRVIWDQPGQGEADQYALKEIDRPVGAMTNTNGLLVVAHARGCHVFSSTKHGVLSLLSQLEWPHAVTGDPVDLVAVGKRDDFVVLFDDGTVQMCNVTAPVGKRY